MNSLESLSKLFTNKIFRIPNYQRGYAWGNKQLEDFWEDIVTLPSGREHYTGMILLNKVNDDVFNNWEGVQWLNELYAGYHVVDGQQRLTTFIIFLSCLLNIAKEVGITEFENETLEDIKGKYIVKYNPKGTSKAYIFGYENDDPSFNYLRYIILGEEGAGDIKESFYTANLLHAKGYFNDKIREFYDDHDAKGLEELYKKLVYRLKFNVQYNEPSFDVYVAFETMNNRGKKLSNLELLKNRLMYLTTLYDDNDLSKSEKENLRREINEAWHEIYFELGRNKNKQLDDDEYLKNHWIMYFTYTRKKANAYSDFLLNRYFSPKAVFGLQNNLSENKQDEIDYETDENGDDIDSNDVYNDDDKLAYNEINKYILSLKNVAKYWYYSFNPDDTNNNFMTAEEKLWMNRLNRVGISYFRPLVVASFVNRDITPEKRIPLLKVIERTIFIFFRMAKYSSSYGSSEAYRFSKDLMNGDISVEEVTEKLEENLNKYLNHAVRAFINNMDNLLKNRDGYYSWSARWYFFFEYEAKLVKEGNELKITSWDDFVNSYPDSKNNKKYISIEHIYPQNASKYYWRNNFRDYDDEEKHILTNSLGNLLAVSSGVNASLQNDEFKDKKYGNNPSKRGYYNGSNSEIEVSKYKQWTPNAIKKRGLELLSFMEERWEFKFESNDDKLRALGLTFMKKRRKHNPKLPNDIDDKQLEEINEYLKTASVNARDLYKKLMSKLYTSTEGIKEELGYIYKPEYKLIDLKNHHNQTIAKVEPFKRLHRVKILTVPPKDEELLKLGKIYGYPEIYTFTTYIKSEEDIENVVNILIAANSELSAQFKE